MVDSLRSVDWCSGLGDGCGDSGMAAGGRGGGLHEAHAHDEADQHGSGGTGEVSVHGGNEGVHGGLLGVLGGGGLSGSGSLGFLDCFASLVMYSTRTLLWCQAISPISFSSWGKGRGAGPVGFPNHPSIPVTALESGL